MLQLKNYFRLLALLCIMGVNNSCELGPIPEDQLEYASSYVILCDLTTSVNAMSIDSVAARAGAILAKLPRPSQATFIPIEADQFAPALFQYEKKLPSKPSERKKFLADDKKAIDELKTRIVSKYDEINERLNGNDPARSCIVTSLRRAHEIFGQNGPKLEESSYNLIIISDMIVECRESILGKVYFTPPGYKQAKKQIATWKPEFDFSYLDNIYLIPSSNEDYHKSDRLSTLKVKDLWSLIFNKLNYTGNNLYFQPWVPRKIE